MFDIKYCKVILPGKSRDDHFSSYHCTNCYFWSIYNLMVSVGLFNIVSYSFFKNKKKNSTYINPSGVGHLFWRKNFRCISHKLTVEYKVFGTNILVLLQFTNWFGTLNTSSTTNLVWWRQNAYHYNVFCLNLLILSPYCKQSREYFTHYSLRTLDLAGRREHLNIANLFFAHFRLSLITYNPQNMFPTVPIVL